MKNLINIIQDEINTDDTTERQSQVQSNAIKNLYNISSPKEKAILDSVFVCLCGWALETLINKEKENNQ